MHRFAFRFAALAAVLSGCATEPVSPEQVVATEERMLQPFATGATVECNELLIEMTGNFNPYVGQPALDPRAHTRRREAGDGYLDQIWVNTLGRDATRFVVHIGKRGDPTEVASSLANTTRFLVRNRIRVRIYQGRHEISLAVRALGVDGSPIAIREAGGSRRVAREFAVEDGVLTTR